MVERVLAQVRAVLDARVAPLAQQVRRLWHALVALQALQHDAVHVDHLGERIEALHHLLDLAQVVVEEALDRREVGGEGGEGGAATRSRSRGRSVGVGVGVARGGGVVVGVA